MGMTRSQYVSLLKGLLPSGRAWPRHVTSSFHSFCEAISEEFVRWDSRHSVDLLNEADPRTASETLEDWERFVGIPDGCVTQEVSLAKRREQVVSRLIARGGQSKQYFIDLATALGFTITITEFKPFVAGSKAGLPACGLIWRFAWQVNSALNTVTYFRAGQNAAGDELASWGNGVLECVFEKKKPAHTTVIFAYT